MRLSAIGYWLSVMIAFILHRSSFGGSIVLSIAVKNHDSSKVTIASINTKDREPCSSRPFDTSLSVIFWRGGRDSNPRGDCSPSGLANRRTRPTMRPPRAFSYSSGGGGGIRTHETYCYVFRFSRPMRSAGLRHTPIMYFSVTVWTD